MRRHRLQWNLDPAETLKYRVQATQHVVRSKPGDCGRLRGIKLPTSERGQNRKSRTTILMSVKPPKAEAPGVASIGCAACRLYPAPDNRHAGERI